MPDLTIHRGLMGAATQTPTDPAARLRALQQRMQARRQVTGQPTPPRQQLNPRPGMPPRPGQGTTQNPGGIMPPHLQQPRPQTNAAPRQFSAPVTAPQQDMPSTPSASPMQAPAAASIQATPQRPRGMPPAPSGINPTVPGVTMPDAAKAPRPRGGIMASMPYEQS